MIFERIYKINTEKRIKTGLGLVVSIAMLVLAVFFSGMFYVNTRVANANNNTSESLVVKLGVIAAESNRSLPSVIQEDFLTLNRMSSDNLSLVYHYSFNISDEQASKVLADKDADENLKNLMFLGTGNLFCKHQAELLVKGVNLVALYSTAEGREFAKAVLTREDCGL